MTALGLNNLNDKNNNFINFDCVYFSLLFISSFISFALNQYNFGFDVFYFSDPAINFLQTGRFESVTVATNPTLEYKTYYDYPLGFPLILYIFFVFFGVSPFTSHLFFYVVNLLISLILYYIFRKNILKSDLPDLFKLLIVSTLSSIVLYFKTDRPDDVSILLFVLNILILNSDNPRYLVYLVFISLLNVIVSPLLGAIFLFIIFCFYFIKYYKCNSLFRIILTSFLFGISLIIVIGILSYDYLANFFPEFINHAKSKEFQISRQVGMYLQMPFPWKIIPIRTILLFLFSSFLVLYLLKIKKHNLFFYVFVVLFVNLFIFLKYLYQSGYLWSIFYAYLLLYIEISQDLNLKFRKIFIFCLFISMLFNVMYFFYGSFQRDYFKQAQVVDQLREISLKIDKTKFILIDQEFYYYIKPFHNKVAQLMYFKKDINKFEDVRLDSLLVESNIGAIVSNSEISRVSEYQTYHFKYNKNDLYLYNFQNK